MIASILREVQDEDIVWSGEWLRLSDESRDSGLLDRVKEFINSSSTSLVHRHLTMETFLQLEHTRTPAQASLGDQIQSGLANLDSSIGMYASDTEAYTYFSLLYNPVIRDYHGLVGKLRQPPVYWGDFRDIGQFSRVGDPVVSTRVRIARSVEGFPFNSKMTIDDYLTLEQTAMTAFSSLTGSLAGTYLSLASLSDTERQDLIEQHLLFGPCDRFLEAAGGCKFWPAGRGIFLNRARTFVVWVGEEDHLRVISLQSGGDLGAVYGRLVEGASALEEGGLVWARSPTLGFLTFCPSNLGTALRASVHVKLKRVGKSELDRWAEEEQMQVRGTGRCTVQYSTVQYSTVQYSTVQYRCEVLEGSTLRRWGACWTSPTPGGWG